MKITLIVLGLLGLGFFLFKKPYTVVVAQNDFTAFIGKKSFKTYKEAIVFAYREKKYFDAVWIEYGGKTETIKEPK